MSKDLYVKNLSQQTTEEDIRTLFAVAGKVTYIHMVVDPKTQQFLGCAYVKMSSEAEAKDAINALNEARYMNSYISVDVALPRTPAGSVRPTPPKKTPRPATAVATEKKRDKTIAKGDWTGPAPTKKATPRRKDGEGERSNSPDWTAAPTGSAPPPRRKSSAPPRSGSPRKGPGPKRDK